MLFLLLLLLPILLLLLLPILLLLLQQRQGSGTRRLLACGSAFRFFGFRGRGKREVVRGSATAKKS